MNESINQSINQSINTFSNIKAAHKSLKTDKIAKMLHGHQG